MEGESLRYRAWPSLSVTGEDIGGGAPKDQEVALQEGTLDVLARDTLGTNDFLG